MMNYWKVIDENYFGQSIQSSKFLKKSINKFKESCLEDKFNDLIQNSTSMTIDKYFTNKAFQISNSDNLNQLNRKNFEKHFFLAKFNYLNALKILDNDQILCESCSKRVESILEGKYNFSIPKRLDSDKKIEKFLKSEQKALEKTIDNYGYTICTDCLYKRRNSPNLRSLDKLILKYEDKAMRCEKKGDQILKKIQERIKQVKHTSICEISLDFDKLKSYLLIQLLELEQKLLADNIY